MSQNIEISEVKKISELNKGFYFFMFVDDICFHVCQEKSQFLLTDEHGDIKQKSVFFSQCFNYRIFKTIDNHEFNLTSIKNSIKEKINNEKLESEIDKAKKLLTESGYRIIHESEFQ